MSSGQTYYQDPQEVGAPIETQTGGKQRVVIGRIFTVDLLVDPNQASARDDEFILRSDDGAYEETLSVANDMVPGDGRCTLEFKELLPGRTYTLLHDKGGQSVVYTMFDGRPYSDFFGGLLEDADTRESGGNGRVEPVAESSDEKEPEGPEWLEETAPAPKQDPDFLR